MVPVVPGSVSADVVFEEAFEVTTKEANPSLFEKGVKCGFCRKGFRSGNEAKRPFIHEGVHGQKHAFHKECGMSIVENYVESNSEKLFCPACDKEIYNKPPLVERDITQFRLENLIESWRKFAEDGLKNSLGFGYGMALGSSLFMPDRETPRSNTELGLAAFAISIYIGALLRRDRSFVNGITMGLATSLYYYRG